MSRQDLISLLNDYTTKVQLRRNRKTEALEYWERFVTDIINSVKRSDRRFANLHIFHTGSYYDGSKVRKPDEFDMMLVMDNLELDGEPYGEDEDDGMSEPPTGFTTVMIDQGEELQWKQDSCVNARGMLNAQRVKEVFARLIRNAIGTLAQRYSSRHVEVKTHGPAVTLELTNSNNGKSYSIDLVIAIKDKSWPEDAEEWRKRRRKGWPQPQLIQEICRDGCYLVARQPKEGRIPEPEKHFLWIFSFAAAEKKLLREGSRGEANCCRKPVLRILKALKDELNWHPLKSYHLKTILFHASEDNPWQWSSDHIGDRFIDLLQRLEKCLREVNCPHYFIKDLNLFEQFPRQRCAELAESVKRIRMNPERVLRK